MRHLTKLLLVITASLLCACPGSTNEPSCGDGLKEGDEDCDQADLGGATCATLVPDSFGTLICTERCTYNISGCQVSPWCGDGVQEGNEDCDLDDLGGATCADMVPNSAGTLVCTEQCTYNTAGCAIGPWCGNGVREFGETCDCGTDIMNLPAGCTDVNGGAMANCSIACERVDLCGDGVQTGTEECDCGNAAWISTLPTGCDAFNGPTSACYDDCTEDPNANCTGEFFDECDYLDPDYCCEDPWAVELECVTQPTRTAESRCVRTCVDSMDCYRNMWCLGPQFNNNCWFAVCSPEAGSDIEAEINGPCQVPGGTMGICTPAIFNRTNPDDSLIGFCVEPGGLGHGAVCTLSLGIDSTDRGEPNCDGLCYGQVGALQGNCHDLCDWQAAYEQAIYGGLPQANPCPAGASCFSESGIPNNPMISDPPYGLRTFDTSICMDTETTNPTDGHTVCSLVTNQLLDNPAQTCATGWTEGRCQMVDYGDWLTDGSLVGWCGDATAATVTTVWGACDPATDVCPAGSTCMEPDVFINNPPTLAAVCVPYCDTAHADGIQQHCANLNAVPTAQGTPTCQSRSWLYGAAGAADLHKSRLGHCAY